MSHGTPWSFHLHWVSWLLVAALALGYTVVVRRPGWGATGRQWILFGCGLVLLAAALTWPLADLATGWSLLALVLQRLLLLLAVPPLLLEGVPSPVLVAATRPAPVDGLVQRCSRPAVAVVLVTAVAVGTLTSGAVAVAASSPAGRAAQDVLLLAAGAVLWAPVLDHVPGAHRMSTLGRAAYLIVQSIVPSFLSIVWIFAHHPLYRGFDRRIAGMSPLLDQRLAGFAAKFLTIALLWTVAFVIVNRAPELTGDAGDEVPLRWIDVERAFERAERAERKRRRREGRAGPALEPGERPPGPPGGPPATDPPAGSP